MFFVFVVWLLWACIKKLCRLLCFFNCVCILFTTVFSFHLFFMLQHIVYQKIALIISWFIRFDFFSGYLEYSGSFRWPFSLLHKYKFLIQYFDSFFWLWKKWNVLQGTFALAFAPAFSSVLAPVLLHFLGRLIISTSSIWSFWYVCKSTSYHCISLFFCFVKVNLLLHLLVISFNLLTFPRYNSACLGNSSTLQLLFFSCMSM